MLELNILLTLVIRKVTKWSSMYLIRMIDKKLDSIPTEISSHCVTSSNLKYSELLLRPPFCKFQTRYRRDFTVVKTGLPALIKYAVQGSHIINVGQ